MQQGVLTVLPTLSPFLHSGNELSNKTQVNIITTKTVAKSSVSQHFHNQIAHTRVHMASEAEMSPDAFTSSFPLNLELLSTR